MKAHCAQTCFKNIVIFSIVMCHDMMEICYHFFLQCYHGMNFFKILLNLDLFLLLKKSISYQTPATVTSGVCGCPELLTVPAIPTGWHDFC